MVAGVHGRLLEEGARRSSHETGRSLTRESGHAAPLRQTAETVAAVWHDQAGLVALDGKAPWV
jgi:hypothetical protein